MRRKKPIRVTRPMCPRVPLAKRFAAIMHRGEQTPWPAKWINAFLELAPLVQPSHLANVERRYRTLWPPNSSKNSLRHDLYTIILQWWVEVDRANAWCDANPEKKERPKIVQMPLAKSEPFIPDQDEMSSIERFNAERRAKGKPSAFQKAREGMGK